MAVSDESRRRATAVPGGPMGGGIGRRDLLPGLIDVRELSQAGSNHRRPLAPLWPRGRLVQLFGVLPLPAQRGRFRDSRIRQSLTDSVYRFTGIALLPRPHTGAGETAQGVAPPSVVSSFGSWR